MRRFLLPLISVAAASPLFGQTVPHATIADSSPARIMAHVGTHTSSAVLRDVLRQTQNHSPRAKLDELADSLVARASNPRSAMKQSAAHRLAVDAVGALISAGSTAASGGEPYSGSLDRLIAVHRQGVARDIRARALGGMLSVSATRTRPIGYLRDVAQSNDSTAYDAVNFLITDAAGGSWVGNRPTLAQQEESIAALKALFTSHRVTNPSAANLLSMWADSYESRHPSVQGQNGGPASRE